MVLFSELGIIGLYLVKSRPWHMMINCIKLDSKSNVSVVAESEYGNWYTGASETQDKFTILC